MKIKTRRPLFKRILSPNITLQAIYNLNNKKQIIDTFIAHRIASKSLNASPKMKFHNLRFSSTRPRRTITPSTSPRALPPLQPQHITLLGQNLRANFHASDSKRL